MDSKSLIKQNNAHKGSGYGLNPYIVCNISVICSSWIPKVLMPYGKRLKQI